MLSNEAPWFLSSVWQPFSCSVDRLRGRFGIVDLRWTIYQLNTSSGTRYPARISDLSPTSNLVSFADGNMSNTVEFTVMDDALPELDELFEVQLSIEAVLGDSATGARLGNFTIAMIVVPENNDPYGLFQIAEGSRMVEVAEDVPTDQPELGSATIPVERTFGTLGDVQVREGEGEGVIEVVGGEAYYIPTVQSSSRWWEPSLYSMYS